MELPHRHHHHSHHCCPSPLTRNARRVRHRRSGRRTALRSPSGWHFCSRSSAAPTSCPRHGCIQTRCSTSSTTRRRSTRTPSHHRHRPYRSDGRGTARPYGSHADPSAALSPPFLPACTQRAPSGFLPYHWLELAETLLAHAADDVPAAPDVRALLRDLQEVRAAKMRGSTTQLAGGGGVVRLRGVGAMELAETRGFVLGVVDGVRRLGASVETSRREEQEEDDERARARGGAADDDNDDDEYEEDMEIA
jgi:hypothetical protein